MHRWYFDGLLEQVKIIHDQRTFTRDEHEYMDMRRRTIGAHPALTIAQYDTIPCPSPYLQPSNGETSGALTDLVSQTCSRHPTPAGSFQPPLPTGVHVRLGGSRDPVSQGPAGPQLSRERGNLTGPAASMTSSPTRKTW